MIVDQFRWATAGALLSPKDLAGNGGAAGLDCRAGLASAPKIEGQFEDAGICREYHARLRGRRSMPRSPADALRKSAAGPHAL